jgi:DNA topoisomerase VI subunit A
MSEKTITISLENMLKGHPRMDEKAVAQSSQRIKKLMKSAVQDFKKKQRTSMEIASRTVLNA